MFVASLMHCKSIRSSRHSRTPHPVLVGPLQGNLLDRSSAPAATKKSCLFVPEYIRLHPGCPCLPPPGPFPPPSSPAALPSCLADIAMGVAHCHANNVIVCDLKPANVILVHDGNRYVAKVSDFGLACGECGKPFAHSALPCNAPSVVAASSAEALHGWRFRLLFGHGCRC